MPAQRLRYPVSLLLGLIALAALGLACCRCCVQSSERFAQGNRHRTNAQRCSAAALSELSQSSFWRAQHDRLKARPPSDDEASDDMQFRESELRSVETKRAKRRRFVIELEAEGRWHEAMAVKYWALAWRPWLSVPPDPPLVLPP